MPDELAAAWAVAMKSATKGKIRSARIATPEGGKEDKGCTLEERGRWPFYKNDKEMNSVIG